VTSALEARPKLVPDVRIVRREHRGKAHFVVKEPREQKYYQFGEMEVGLMKLMDGHRTPTDISYAAAEQLGLRPEPGQIADFAQKLKRLGLVERTPSEQHLMLMERLRSERKVRARRHTRGSILRLRFSVGDPDRLFAWAVKRIGWMWTPPFVLFCLALFAVYGVIVISNWSSLWAGTVGLVTLSGFGPWDWVLLYFLSLVIIGIHELGHGLTTKYFGGEVHEMGGVLGYFSPALFCNTNDAWTFEKRAHRLWVTFAGPWIQLVIAAVAAIVWVLTEPATAIHHVAFLCVLIGGILSVLTNFNALIPLDGYYALSDWLEIPNLRRRSFDYWGWLSKKHLLGLEVAPPPTTPRERRVFLIYGGLSIAYTAVVIVASAFWLILVIGRLIGPWVWLIAAFSAARALRKLVARSRTLAMAATATWRAGFLRGTRGAVLVAGCVLVIGLPFIVPWTFRAHGTVQIEALPRRHVRAQVDGIIDRLHVSEGDTVRAGDAIATLWNSELEASVIEHEARVEHLNLEQAHAEATGDLAKAASASSVLGEAQQELAVLRRQQEKLVITAPIDGVILGHRLYELQGAAATKGTLLLEVAALEGRCGRVRITLSEGGEVAPGQRATIKLVARPNLKFRSTISSVAPAAEHGWLEAEIILPNGQWQPAPGMVGVAKVEFRRATVAQALLRAMRQTIRLDLWL
jgi:putative peptide zinc metalloprotease protein